MMRVLVVDDHAIVRSGIRRLLSERTDIEVQKLRVEKTLARTPRRSPPT